MRTISNSEFAAHPEMYLDMARNSEVRVRKGDEMFRIVFEASTPPQAVLQPDDDLRNAVTGEELLKGIHEDISRKFASRV
jgi:hypothetical protein